jgi:enamine deaminase RidA (YjgF/YER057c/UK114 family)
MDPGESSRRWIFSGSPWEDMAGYARAVLDGEWVFVSGTVGFDLRTGLWPATAAEQAAIACSTIVDALHAAEVSIGDIVRVRVYVPDRADVPAVSAVLKERFGSARPANTTVCCALAVEQALVEIEVTARKRQVQASR